jgi:hypothetical protein
MCLSNDASCNSHSYSGIKQKIPQDVLMSAALQVYQIELNAALCGCTYNGDGWLSQHRLASLDMPPHDVV